MSIINVGMSWAWNGRVLGVVIFVPKVVPKKLAPMLGTRLARAEVGSIGVSVHMQVCKTFDYSYCTNNLQSCFCMVAHPPHVMSSC